MHWSSTSSTSGPNSLNIGHVGIFGTCDTSATLSTLYNLERKDSKGRVSGGKDLASTAYYPSRFCGAVFRAWNSEYLKDLENETTDSVIVVSDGPDDQDHQIGELGEVGELQ